MTEVGEMVGVIDRHFSCDHCDLEGDCRLVVETVGDVVRQQCPRCREWSETTKDDFNSQY